MNPPDQQRNKKRKVEGSPAGSSTSGGSEQDDIQDSSSIILAMAVLNKKSRLFIPSKENKFGGIAYDNVMVDSGCSSVLLPFPIDDPGASLAGVANDRYDWTVTRSKGTGAVHSPVLKIKSKIGQEFDLKLAGKDQPIRLPFLRFHLGKQAAGLLLDSFGGMLQQKCKEDLRSFVRGLGDDADVPERRHVLLGLSYIRKVCSVQTADIVLFLDGNRWHLLAAGLPGIFAQKSTEARELAEAFEGFDDLEDEDHDGDADEEDVRRSWDPDDEECTDELVT